MPDQTHVEVFMLKSEVREILKGRRLGLAERLKTARQDLNLSQEGLAEMMHWDRPTVSEIEAGRRAVKAEELSLLAELLSIDSHTLSWYFIGK